MDFFVLERSFLVTFSLRRASPARRCRRVCPRCSRVYPSRLTRLSVSPFFCRVPLGRGALLTVLTGLSVSFDEA